MAEQRNSRLYPAKECYDCPLRFECLGIDPLKSEAARKAGKKRREKDGEARRARAHDGPIG